MNTPIIEVRNLSKTFVLHQQGGVAIEALSGISFSVDAGECVALHGPSGAGKSTLLRALYGNYLPTGGSIRVRCGGEDVDITSAAPRTVIRRPEDPVMAISTVLGWTSVSISLGVKENSIPRSLAIEKESGIRLSSVENPIMPPKRARSVPCPR